MDGNVVERRPRLRLFALSFAALFLELMVIRWVPASIRFVAYYSNLMLISSFLGLGIGAILARRKRSLIGLFPVILAVDVILLASCHHLVAPTGASEARFYVVTAKSPVFYYFVLVGVFIANTTLFVPLGQEIGRLFGRQAPLLAYSFDLGGSLCGTLVFGVFSLYRFSPIIGFAAAGAAFLLATQGRRLVWNVVLLLLVLLVVPIATSRAAIWSPYYYITISMHTVRGDDLTVSQPPPNLRTVMNPPYYEVHVNTDFYQAHGTLDLRRYTPRSRLAERVKDILAQYALPYKMRDNPQSVCVVGAGGGMDVEAALLNGAQSVDAVEIDPVLVSLAHRFSAADVYDDPRVHVFIDDGRAFLRASRKRYDMIIFGFLDSQALFSSSSNIRLDGYIYTVQSMRRAFDLLRPDGLLCVSFTAARPWIEDKLRLMLQEATGQAPLVYTSEATVFLCERNGAWLSPPPAQQAKFSRVDSPPASADVPQDDWPYLYLSHRTIPADYLLVIGTLVGLSAVTIILLRLGGGENPLRIGAAEGHFFFMGLGFLLLETKSIGDCSLYFGTTWLVTLIVVSGVLLMVLAANLLAMRLRRASLLFYLPLLISLVGLYLTPRDVILGFPYAARLVWALICVPLPIFFAGLIFSTTFRDGGDPATLLGVNLLGATVGGFSEYLSMAIGMRALMLIVIGAYLASLCCLAIRRATVAVPAQGQLSRLL